MKLKEVFTTKGFGDQCKLPVYILARPELFRIIIFNFCSQKYLAALVLVYDYHPGSQTLLSKYFTPTNETNGYADPFQGDARPFRLILCRLNHFTLNLK